MIDLVTAEFVRWANENLPAEPYGLMNKLREEIEEFFEDPCGAEAADVLFCLARVCHALGIDLSVAARAKFEVIQGRTYELRPDGTWHHIVELA